MNNRFWSAKVEKFWLRKVFFIDFMPFTANYCPFIFWAAFPQGFHGLSAISLSRKRLFRKAAKELPPVALSCPRHIAFACQRIPLPSLPQKKMC